jgi:hypothetical protein
MEAVQRGAQGWLSKAYFDNYLVPQSRGSAPDGAITLIERCGQDRRMRRIGAVSFVVVRSSGVPESGRALRPA